MDKEALKTIIERYEKNKNDTEFVKNERQICNSLIFPFFKHILDWDTEEPSEFKYEYSQSGKRMDCIVFLNGISQFVIEAKSISKDIVDNHEFYQQAINYAHSKEKPFAILTNFKDSIILRCDVEVDNALKAEIGKVSIDQIREGNLGLLWNFNKKYWIEKGKDNELYLRLNIKRRRPVDEELLEDMKKWRTSLLTNIKKNQKFNDFDFEKEIEHIEEETQRFADRLIFICFCEDKELEEAKLKSLLNDKRGRYWNKPGFLLNEIKNLFVKYRNKYNSDLFFDGYCDKFYIEDTILYNILEDLRQPPKRLVYDFKSIGLNILGKAYENFIGHLIAGKKRFREESNKGKRKKEGIYYTPEYVVDYIVNNIGEEYIKNKDIYKIKILDPACGSGSFLLRAFDLLCETLKEKLKRELNYEEKENLLLKCILGIDKDERACDIAKLSISLKLAERDKKLPELYRNIRNGDSIIDNENIVGNKAFEWKKQFKEIMDSGGFDIIIGNPPYVSIRGMPPEQIKFLFDNYKTTENRINLYSIFIERAIELLKKGGYFGFIIPNSILFNSSYKKIRKKLIEETNLIKIVRLPDNVFQDAKVETIILIFKKNEDGELEKTEVLIYDRNDKLDTINHHTAKKHFKVNQNLWKRDSSFIFNIFSNEEITNLKKKIEKNTEKLVNLCDFSLGITPYDKYKGHTEKQIKDKVFHASYKKDNTYKKLLSGADIIRYGVFWNGKQWIKYGDWLGAPREKRFFTDKHIVVRQIVSGDPLRIYAAYTDQELCNTQIGFNMVLKPSAKVNLKYILAVINSKLMNFYHSRKFLDVSKSLFQKILIQNAKLFPIKIPNSQKEEKIVQMVDEMINLVKRLNEIGDKKTDERRRIEEKIKKINEKIDYLVYDIYGITEKEKKIIEDSFK